MGLLIGVARQVDNCIVGRMSSMEIKLRLVENFFVRQGCRFESFRFDSRMSPRQDGC